MDKFTGANLGLEHQISELQRKNRHLEQANGTLVKQKRENEDLILQNERLQQKLIDAKMRMDGMRFDQKASEGVNKENVSRSNFQLKEADQIIEELTNTLQRRESEMAVALSENEQLMERYRKLENELQMCRQTVKDLKGRHTDEMINAENRIKLTQEQAMS